MSVSGNQPKTFVRPYWYKKDLYGGEAVSEVAVSLLYEYLFPGILHIRYRLHPNDPTVCISRHLPGEVTTLSDLAYAQAVPFDSLTSWVLSSFSSEDIHTLQVMHLMDYLTSNPDRHLNNILLQDGHFVIFDHGFSFGVRDRKRFQAHPLVYRDQFSGPFFGKNHPAFSLPDLTLGPVFPDLGGARLTEAFLSHLPYPNPVWPWLGECLVKLFGRQSPAVQALPDIALRSLDPYTIPHGYRENSIRFQVSPDWFPGRVLVSQIGL